MVRYRFLEVIWLDNKIVEKLSYWKGRNYYQKEGVCTGIITIT